MRTTANKRCKNLVVLLALNMLLLVILPTIAMAEGEPTSVIGITLDRSELILEVEGEPELLAATVEPRDATNQTLIWSSSDEMVATVADGEVTPVAPGAAVVTVLTEDGGFTATCAVVVNELSVTTVPITGVFLDQLELNLKVGEAPILLSATIEPSNASGQEVIWSSTDVTVATVVDGLVTPIAPGEAEVIVAAGEHTAKCEVVVEEPTDPFISVDEVYLNKTTLTLVVGEDAELLLATIEPSDATEQKLTWTSSNEDIVIVDNGLVIPLAEGTVTITVTAYRGLAATCDVTVNEASLPLPRIAPMGAHANPPLISNESAGVTVDYEVNEGYEWVYNADYSYPSYGAYVAGNSFTYQANVSNIAITVTGSGVFSFDYQVSTRPTGNNCALFYNINKPVDASNYTLAKNYGRRQDFRGSVPWTNEQFNITADDLDESGNAVVYIVYHKGSDQGLQDDMVAIANVCFASGTKALTLDIDDTDYGHVIDSDSNIYLQNQNILQYDSGDEVELTAVPEEEGRFLGWIDGSGQLITTNTTYLFTISQDTVLTAIFGKKERFVARRNNQFYTGADGGLAQALLDAGSGDTIVMLENQTLSEDATIPVGVKLYVPFSDDFFAEGNADGVNTSESYFKASAKIATSDKVYRTLIIEEDVTLTVNGTLIIGSVIGYPGQSYQGHTSGWHGKIDNNGCIIVKSGGILDSWGLITGNGTVAAQSGSSVYEPFIVYDFAGGMNSYYLYSDKYPQSPFKQYAIQNIQNQLILNSGSRFYVHCNLYADSQYNKTDINFIGTGGLYQPAGGATVTRTYDGTKCISTDTDIGKTTYTFNGGMTCTSMSIIVLDVAISTEKVEFPIPYNWDMVLENGDYWFEGKVKLMPGATLVVKDDAILRVQDRFFVLDGLIQSDMSGKIYPSTDTLQSAGFSGSGQLFVNGTMIVADGATFGGIVQTQTSSENPVATVTVEKGAIVNKTSVQDGAVGGYDVNTSIFDLSARMYIYDGTVGDYTLEGLVAERTYSSYAATPWSIDGYIMKYAVDCAEAERSPDIPERSSKFHKWVTTEVTLDEERSGSWVMNDLYYTVRVINKTAYNSADSSRVTIIADGLEDDRAYTAAGDEFSFTITATEAGKGYVSLITRTTSSGEPARLVPNAEGNYVINEVNDDITITVTSCRLGDVNLDTKVNVSDLLELSRIIAGYKVPTTLERLAVNTDRDPAGRVNVSDLLQLSRYIAGYINAF